MIQVHVNYTMQARIKLKLGETLWVCAPGETPVAVREDCHYQLGQPVDDVVGGQILTGSREVTWCSASQQWVG